MSRDSHLRRFSRLKRTSSLSRADPESRNYWDSFFFFFSHCATTSPGFQGVKFIGLVGAPLLSFGSTRDAGR